MPDRRRFLTGALASAALLFVVPSAGPAAGVEDAARKFIESLGDRAIHALTKQEVPRRERVKRFRHLFNENFAVADIGQWILGRYWRKATENQRGEYLALFEDLMVVSYVDRFTAYAGENLTITKTLPAGDAAAIVFSEIVRPAGGPPVRVNWRVGVKDEAYKIVDVIVEGTSMSTTLRSDFGSIIRRSGGEVAGLIDELRKKTKSLGKTL